MSSLWSTMSPPFRRSAPPSEIAYSQTLQTSAIRTAVPILSKRSKDWILGFEEHEQEIEIAIETQVSKTCNFAMTFHLQICPFGFFADRLPDQAPSAITTDDVFAPDSDPLSFRGLQL